MRPLLALGLLAAMGVPAQDVATRAAQILRDNCLQCHGPAAMGGLNLASRDAALRSGPKGPAIVPGEWEKSRLIEAIVQSGALKMPPGRKLSETDIGILRDWVTMGAPYESGAAPAQAATWWSFQKPRKPAGAGGINGFIAAALTKEKMRPHGRADSATLIRRAYFDLHGLPPTSVEIQEFAANNRADAYEKLVDRLLASPRYGEKWGRFWLDLVRYSDTAGYEADPYTADAWRYRDYVIKSFNEDKPYDRFVKEQIAGDELFPEEVNARIGTGYYCVGPNRDINPEQAETNREETLTDWVDTTGSAFLGLTVGCARCHDHKFDPIPQRDYFGMRAVFIGMVKTRIPMGFLPSLFWDISENRREVQWHEWSDRVENIQARCRKSIYESKASKLDSEVRLAVETPEIQRTPRQQELFEVNRRAVAVGQDEIRACLNEDEGKRLAVIERNVVGQLLAAKPKPYACGVTDLSREVPHTYMPVRGSKLGQRVPARLLSALGGGEIPEPSEEATTSLRRKALAEWIASADNPLTARVIVNRVWQQHFGRGLMPFPSDFGTRGQLPSHPELLDWLAVHFVENGWSFKKLHRQILLSEAYQRAPNPSKELAEKDPQNLWLAYFQRRRLTAEEIRDAILQSSGALNLKAGGRPVVTPLSQQELYNLTKNAADAWIVTEDASEHNRRSVYLINKRTFKMPMMDVFDTPESMLSCPRRESSTTAPQSLTLLNGSFTMTQAQRLGDQLARDHAEDKALVREAWLRVLGRLPRDEESALALTLLEKQTANLGSRHAAAAELARGLFNLNEFLYVH